MENPIPNAVVVIPEWKALYLEMQYPGLSEFRTSTNDGRAYFPLEILWQYGIWENEY